MVSSHDSGVVVTRNADLECDSDTGLPGATGDGRRNDLSDRERGWGFVRGFLISTKAGAIDGETVAFCILPGTFPWVWRGVNLAGSGFFGGRVGRGLWIAHVTWPRIYLEFGGYRFALTTLCSLFSILVPI